MGPGLNAYCERMVFGQDYPHIDFWDQPPCQSMNALIDRVVNKIEHMSKTANQPIDLICHSFGGLLAVYALQTKIPRVRSLLLLGTGFFYKKSFENIAKALTTDPNTAPDVRVELTSVLNKVSKDLIQKDFWSLFNAIVKDPEFMRLYWHSTSQYQNYKATLANAPSLSVETFSAVSNDVIEMNPRPSKSEFQGPVHLYLGENDPLINIPNEAVAWKTVFPKLQLTLIPKCGHFVHFELNKIPPIDV